MNKEHEIQFGTLHADGSLTDVRMVKQSMFANCPFAIIWPEHYRADDTCLCSNKAERKRMIAEWEYTAKQFERIRLID